LTIVAFLSSLMKPLGNASIVLLLYSLMTPRGNATLGA